MSDIPMITTFLGYTETEIMDFINAAKNGGYDFMVRQHSTTKFKLQSQLAELKAEDEKVRKLLRAFGRHLNFCISQRQNIDKCDCGYEAALNPASAEGKP